MSERPSQPDDATLVLRSRAGDREAFGCLYDRYARLVRAVAYDEQPRLADSCDITQEAFLRAWQKISALKESCRTDADCRGMLFDAKLTK